MSFFTQQLINHLNYHFNLYSLIFFFAGLLILSFIFIIIKRENFSQQSLMFSFVAASVVIWIWSYTFLLSSTTESVACWWGKMQNSGVVFIPTASLFLTLSLINKFKYYKAYAVTSFIISVFFVLFTIFTKSFVEGVYSYSWGFHVKYASKMPAIFLAYFTLVMGFVVFLFFKEFRNAKTIKQKNRYKLFIINVLIANTGAVDFLPAYGVKFFPIGFLSVLFFLAGLFFLIKRYELMDIIPEYASQQIIETMNDILFLFNKNGIIQFANKAALEFFGLNSYEVIDKHILQVIDDPNLSKNFNKIAKVGSVNDFEIFYTKGHKGKRCLNLSIFSIKNELRQILAMVCIGRDRTEYKKAEDELKKAYLGPNTIIEAMPVGIVVYDNNNRVRQINKTALNYTGLNTENDIINRPYKIKTLDTIKETTKTKFIDEANTTEEVIAFPDGNNLSVLKTTLPINISNENLFLDVFVDITDRKGLERKLDEYKIYLEKLVEERTNELGSANTQLLDEVSDRKKIEEDLRSYIFDLEKFKKITIDRENKLMELKKEANKLSKELNEPRPFNI